MKSQQSSQVNNTQGTYCSQDVAEDETQDHDNLAESDANITVVLEKDSLEEGATREVSENISTCSTKTTETVQVEKGEESVCIHQVKAGFSFVELKVGNRSIKARIDSGAEITILSLKIYEQLVKAPAKIKNVDLQMADNDTVLKGFIIQPLKMKLGNQSFSERVYVAAIGDDMLLGHDLLHHLGVCLDMQTDTLILNGERVPITTSFKDGRLTVARVSLQKKVTVPPNSVVRLSCKMDTTMPDDYFIESVERLKVLMARTVCAADTDPIICLVNPTDTLRTLKKGAQIGNAYEVIALQEDEILVGVSCSNTGSSISLVNEEGLVNPQEQAKGSDVSCSNIGPSTPLVKEEDAVGRTTHVQEEQVSLAEQEIPEHLKQLYETSMQKLSAEQRQNLKKLLCDNQDVFAKHDFDLGTVTAIQHTIDTGTARPIKQHMRRTPACFANEEEELLKKMLDAGVIQESVSD